LLNKTEKPSKCVNQWIYAKSCLVHDFNLSNHQISFDLYISPKGWELQLFARNNKSKTYLRKLILKEPLNRQNYEQKASRFILEIIDLKTDINTVKEKLLDWINILLESEKNLNAN